MRGKGKGWGTYIGAPFERVHLQRASAREYFLLHSYKANKLAGVVIAASSLALNQFSYFFLGFIKHLIFKCLQFIPEINPAEALQLMSPSALIPVLSTFRQGYFSSFLRCLHYRAKIVPVVQGNNRHICIKNTAILSWTGCPNSIPCRSSFTVLAAGQGDLRSICVPCSSS